jgi:O-antigen/teichoic acid export membrane protein
MYFPFKDKTYSLLRWSEQYTGVNMIYAASTNFWLTGGRVISVGSGILLTIAFANWIPPEVFGTYKYVIAAAGFTAAFSLSGLSAALMRAVAQGNINVTPVIVKTAILWSIPASFVTLCISGYYFLQGNEALGIAFVLISFSNVIGNGVGLAKSVWYGTGNFKAFTIAGIPRIVIPIAVLLATLYVTDDIIWILIAYFVTQTLASISMYRWTLRRLHIVKDTEHVPETVKYGKQISVLSFFQLAGGQLDQLLLWHFLGPVSLAVYAIALSPMQEARNFLSNFFSMLFPRFATKDEKEIRHILPVRVMQMILISTIVVVVYILIIPFVFEILFPRYMEAVLVSQVLALVLIFHAKGIIETKFVAQGEVGKRYIAVLSTQVLKLALLFTLIPLYGLWGAVAAILLSEIGSAVILYGVYKMA